MSPPRNGAMVQSIAVDSVNRPDDVTDKLPTSLDNARRKMDRKSFRSVTEAERSVVSEGINYVITSKHENSQEFIAEDESLISLSDLPDDAVYRIGFEVSKGLQAFKPYCDIQTSDKRHALSNLRKKRKFRVC